MVKQSAANALLRQELTAAAAVVQPKPVGRRSQSQSGLTSLDLSAAATGSSGSSEAAAAVDTPMAAATARHVSVFVGGSSDGDSSGNEDAGDAQCVIELVRNASRAPAAAAAVGEASQGLFTGSVLEEGSVLDDLTASSAVAGEIVFSRGGCDSTKPALESAQAIPAPVVRKGPASGPKRLLRGTLGAVKHLLRFPRERKGRE